MQHFVWGILLLPLAGFLLNSLITRFTDREVTWIGPGSVGLAFICALISFAWLQGQSDPNRLYNNNAWQWTLSGNFRLNFGLWLDPLSSTMTLIITGVGFLILVYSVGYMHNDPGYRRFFAQMDLFIFTMLLLVLANNFVWLLVGWAGVGLTSYLLIGYYFLRPSAVAAARKAFVMNVIGDWGIMIAIFMMFILFGGVDFQTVFTHAHTLPLNGQIITVMCLLLLVGAIAKSAQLPLYTWLPDAMEGPTPVSALIHAATMVTAGVYLIARSYPLYQQSPHALHVVAFIGAIGTVYAATMGLANNDIKRVLAFSTMSQIAYMFTGVGVAVYSAGMFHLLEHAFFKALLFMGAGAVMHALSDELNIQRMGGLRAKMPFTHITFLIGILAIIGFPFFSGFYSKEDVIASAFYRAQHGDSWMWLAWALTVIAAGLTAAYMFRLYFLVFYGQPRDRHLYDHAHDPSMPMRVPMAVLALLSIVGGWIAVPHNRFAAWLSPVFSRFSVNGPPIIEPTVEWTSTIIVLIVTAVGFLAAYAIYYRGSPSPQRTAAAAPWLYRLFYYRYYVDELYDALLVRPITFLGRLTYRFIDQATVDGTVNWTGYATQIFSSRLRRIQTGYARNYALSILFGAVLVVAYYVVGGR